MSRPRLSGPGPCIAGCGRKGDDVSGFCSDTCLQSMFIEDDVPITVLAPNKAGGFGRGLAWQVPQPLRIPMSMRIHPRGQTRNPHPYAQTEATMTDDHVQEQWVLENADGDEVLIELWRDGESVRVCGGDGEAGSYGRDHIVRHFVPKYEAAGYTVTANYEVG